MRKTHLPSIHSWHEVKISDHLWSQRPTITGDTFPRGQVTKVRQFTQPNISRSRQGVWVPLFHGKRTMVNQDFIISRVQPAYVFPNSIWSFWKHAPAGRPGGQYPVHCSFTCVPGKSSFALLIIIFVQEDLRSSAIVSPPFPIMWPETLLEKTTIMFFSFQCLNKTWVQASWGGCPCPRPDVAWRCSHCQSRCQGGSTALPWKSKVNVML